jgi:hypothetical protein
MKKIKKKHVILMLVVSAAALVAAWALFGRHENASVTTEPGRESLEEHWEKLANHGVKELQSRPLGHRWPYSHLRGEGREMPPKMRHATSKTLRKSGPLKLRFDQSQYVVTPAGVGLWVVRGRGVTCMFIDKTAAVSCATTAQVERRGLLLEVYRTGPPPRAKPTHFLALGIAPDWARAVRATIDGEPKTIPIVDNAYAQRAETPIKIQPLTR